MAHKKGERRERAKRGGRCRYTLELEQLEGCAGISKRYKGYSGNPGKRSVYELYWNRKIKCDLLTLQKVRRHFVFDSPSMYTWIKAITPMSGSAGGWLVEYDTYDGTCRFENVAFFDHEYQCRWKKDVDLDPPLKMFWPGRPLIDITPTPNSYKNRTYRRAA